MTIEENKNNIYQAVKEACEKAIALVMKSILLP